MENFDEPMPASNPEEQIAFVEQAIVFPPKYEKPEQSSNIWLRSFMSLAAYLVLGYYIFPSYKILLLITAIVIIHELGHFFAMKFFRYKDLGIFFIPLLGAYVSGSKREVSQKESAIILLAGPLPGIIIGIGFYLLFKTDMTLSFAGLSFYTIAISFILLNLINLLPVYPLDGGQLLNRVFLDEESWVSKIFVFLSIGFMVWFALYGGSRPFYPLLLFPLMMILRMFGDSRLKSLEKKIHISGIDMDKSYEDLPDEDYWKMRNIIIEEHPSFKDVPPAPPYEYDTKEEKLMTTIQSLLHRHLIQDLSVIGKIFIILLWVGAFAAPWFLEMYQAILSRFGY
ncbi:MAG: site-2 protease family protein [Bacteroidota bacterium]|nr:site-2 protease family protein [Bacteroidota bacterium]